MYLHSSRSIFFWALTVGLAATPCLALWSCGTGATPGPPPPSPSPTPLVTLYQVPTPNSFPAGIVSGPDGNIWFAEGVNTINKVSRLSVASGQITEFSLPGCARSPEYLADGSDGNLWVGAICPLPPALSEVVKLSGTGVAQLITLPTAPNAIFHETRGPDGNVWVTFDIPGDVGKITPAGVATYYSLATAVHPTHIANGIITGPGNNIWIADGAGFIDEMNTNGQILNEFPVPDSIDGIAEGADGNLWFTSEGDGAIGKMTPSGNVTTFQLSDQCSPNGDVGPLNIINGPGGNLWITESLASGIGIVSLAGQVSTICLPATTGGPFDLTLGSDDNVWFTFPGFNEIGKIVPTLAAQSLRRKF